MMRYWLWIRRFLPQSLSSGRCAFAAVACAALTLSGCAAIGVKPTEPAPAAQAKSGDPIADLIGKAVAEEAHGDAADDAAPSATVITGSGRFLNTASRARPAANDARTVRINLSNASIADAAKTVLGDILGVNYVIEDGLEGAITLQTAEPIAASTVISVFETALRSKGIALIDDNGLYRLAPADTAYQTSPAVSAGAAGLGYGVRIVPLRYVSATEMARILKPMAPSGGVLRVDPSRNLLTLSGSQRELQSMMETIKIFDVDWLQGMSFALLPVRAAEPDDVAQELETIFGAGSGKPLEGLVRFIPNKRLNSILAITAQPKYLLDARSWVERLDVPRDLGGERLFVYNVQNRPADELAGLLQNLFGKSPGNGYASTQNEAPFEEQPVAPGKAPGVIGDGSDDLGQENGSGFGAGSGFGGNTGFGSAPGALQRRGSRNGGGAVVDNAGMRIFADSANNSIVILSSPAEYAQIERMLEKLDVLPNQVLLEATIAEVTLKDELEHGLRWFFQNSKHSATFTDAASGAITSNFPGFSYMFSGADVRVVLNALSSLTHVNVVSSPTIMVLDNKTAVLQVGDQVPVATQSAVSITNPDAPIVNSVTFRDTGVILNITPRVNDSGVVVLDINQEVSNVVSTTSSGIDSPTIQQRRISTTVAVQDGESLALGGLIQDSENTNSSGVPLLQRVPVLGEAFKSKTKKKERTELLILITPRVIRNAAEARAATEEFKARLEKAAPLGEQVSAGGLAHTKAQ